MIKYFIFSFICFALYSTTCESTKILHFDLPIQTLHSVDTSVDTKYSNAKPVCYSNPNNRLAIYPMKTGLKNNGEVNISLRFYGMSLGHAFFYCEIGSDIFLDGTVNVTR